MSETIITREKVYKKEKMLRIKEKYISFNKQSKVISHVKEKKYQDKKSETSKCHN